jgi:hypothetical protein
MLHAAGACWTAAAGCCLLLPAACGAGPSCLCAATDVRTTAIASVG